MLVAMDTQTGGMEVQLSSCSLLKGLGSVSYCCLSDIVVMICFCSIDIDIDIGNVRSDHLGIILNNQR